MAEYGRVYGMGVKREGEMEKRREMYVADCEVMTMA